jgi:hypothetical protein
VREEREEWAVLAAVGNEVAVPEMGPEAEMVDLYQRRARPGSGFDAVSLVHRVVVVDTGDWEVILSGIVPEFPP